MKVLKNNYNKMMAHESKQQFKPYPREHICENCNSILEYDESDIYIGVFGTAHIDCSLCGYSNMLDEDEHNITLTKDNIKFPIHFHHTSVETGAIDNCTTEYIRNCVKEAIRYFRANKNEFAISLGSGTTMVHVFRYSGDEEYNVVVSKDYYSTYIPFEDEDYGGNGDYY